MRARKLLEINGEKFMNTPETSNYLVKGKPDYIGEHVTVNPYLKYWVFEGGSRQARPSNREKPSIASTMRD